VVFDEDEYEIDLDNYLNGDSCDSLGDTRHERLSRKNQDAIDVFLGRGPRAPDSFDVDWYYRDLEQDGIYEWDNDLRACG
jgi:hypothetical protein